PSPPLDRLVPGVAFMFHADKFALPMVEAESIVNAKRLWRFGRSAPLGMDAINNVLDFVLDVGDLPRQNARFTRLRFVLLALRGREFISTIGAACISGSNERLAFGT